MYGVNEAVIIASLAIPAGLFIGFSTIPVNRFRECMGKPLLLQKNKIRNHGLDYAILLVAFCLIVPLITN